MAVAVFDTLRAAKRLKSLGFTDQQAEGVAEMMGENRETDLADLATRSDLAALTATTRSDLEALAATTKKDMEQLEQRLKKDLELLEQRLTIKLGLMLGAGIAVVATLVGLF
jgi:hypothetical protein